MVTTRMVTLLCLTLKVRHNRQTTDKVIDMCPAGNVKIHINKGSMHTIANQVFSFCKKYIMTNPFSLQLLQYSHFISRSRAFLLKQKKLKTEKFKTEIN